MNKRTLKQSNALHLYFGLIAQSLNDAGLDIKTVLLPGFEVPWSKKTVKDLLWRPIQKVQVGKISTTELTTVEIDQIFDTLNRYLGEKFGIYKPFPSIDAIINRTNQNETITTQKNS